MTFWPRNIRTLHLTALALLALVFALPLWANNESRDAREILSRPEYKGYRMEEPRPSDVERSEGSIPVEPPPRSGDQPRENVTSGEPRDGNRYRRSTSSSGPPRRGSTGRESSRSDSGGSSDFGGGPSLDTAILQAIFWVVIIIAAVIALVFIVRAFMDRKPKKKTKSADAKVETVTQQDDITSAVPAGFPALEAELDAALKAGNYALAALLRYKLFWLMAGWQGAVNESEVKTWRDALKLVQVDETRREIRRLLFLVESVRYGRHKPRAEEYQQWRQKLETIDPLAVLG